MPALLILAVISWLLGTGKPRAKADDLPLFTVLELRPKPRWRVFFVSAVSHTICLCLLFLFSDLFSTPDDDFLASRVAGHALVIKLPEHIYLAPAAGHDFPATARLTHRPRVSVQRKDLRKYSESGCRSEIDRAARRSARRGAGRPFFRDDASAAPPGRAAQIRVAGPCRARYGRADRARGRGATRHPTPRG